MRRSEKGDDDDDDDDGNVGRRDREKDEEGGRGENLLLIAHWLGTALRCYRKLGREEWLGEVEGLPKVTGLGNSRTKI